MRNAGAPVKVPCVARSGRVYKHMNKLILTVKKSETDVQQNTQYRLDVSTIAADPATIDSLLVVRRSAGASTLPEDQIFDQFFGVARLVDLTTLGIGSPRDGELFYLADQWTLIFAHSDTRESAITALKNDIDKLSKELKSFNSPEVETEEVFEVEY